MNSCEILEMSSSVSEDALDRNLGVAMPLLERRIAPGRPPKLVDRVQLPLQFCDRFFFSDHSSPDEFDNPQQEP